ALRRLAALVGRGRVFSTGVFASASGGSDAAPAAAAAEVRSALLLPSPLGGEGLGVRGGQTEHTTGAQKKVRASLRKPGRPSILTGPVHPFGSLAALSAPPRAVKSP